MSESAGRDRGGGSKPRIGEEAKEVYLTAMRRGARQEDAARAAGFSRSAFSRLRGRDAGFARSFDDAVAFSSGPRYVSAGKGRVLQLRRFRRVPFTDERKRVFLEYFAATCNLADSAEAAGVCASTVLKHLAADAEFAALFRTALEQGYARLEAALLQRRLYAQERLRWIEPGSEAEPEFERALKLLQRWERRDGTLGLRRNGPRRTQPRTFDEAIEAIERKLKAIGVPIREVPPEDEGEGEGEGGSEGEKGA
jgi:hypothetical protein